MILQKDIRKFSAAWAVPPDTVDKDYVLGHFLTAFHQQIGDELIFKGGTCLRKCYFPDYRFSEDLDFTACNEGFSLKENTIKKVCQTMEQQTGILLYAEKIYKLLHKNEEKGYQVRIRYWGANHSKNQQPLPPDRWLTKLKLEISTKELCLLSPSYKTVHHPYPDALLSAQPIPCYTLEEIIAEKLRSLVQRSYTAPRDFFDLYHLTQGFSYKDWQNVKALFIKKMSHKGFLYTGPSQLIKYESIKQVRKAWQSSIAHQVNNSIIDSSEIINEVIRRIDKYL